MNALKQLHVLFNQNNVKQYHVLLSQYKTNHKHILMIPKQIIKQASQLKLLHPKQALQLNQLPHHLKQEEAQDKSTCFNKELHHSRHN